MTTPTGPTPATTTSSSRTAEHDQALTDLATSSGHWLAGLITAGMLDTAGTPDRLPELAFTHHGLDPAAVREIWQAGLAVGYRAGRIATTPRLHRDTLTRLQTALTHAGYTAMGRLTAQSLTVTAVHPADDDTVRGGHE
ncbi:hypothetical protein [Streptomyces sp. NPDC018584]|uniref:hypothetical protein n=1 Tax=unclassified Streptomyces TaxID=2593676 RepID=UPI003791D130